VDIGTVSFVPEAWVTSSIMLFVDVHHGYDQSAVADEVAAICNEAGALVSSTEVYDELVAELMDDPTFGALSDFLYMEYALSFIIMCVGVGLVIFVTVSERERELACIMARGSSSSQMRKVLMGESLSLMSLGFVVGATTGIFSAWLFDALLQFVSNNGSVSTSIIIGNVTVAILVASLVSFVLASFLATSRLGRLRLAEVLRIRGG
jgi:predicted lysophospholipase L1 biosynthesis ABC-type transport system permease subunit